MACTIKQADLGPSFADVDPDVAQLWIDTATEIVLGPTACQAETELAWRNCCVDPCRAIVLLAQHLLASDPDSGSGDKDVASERVADVAVTYVSAGPGSDVWQSTTYGRAYSAMLANYERCSQKRKTTPVAGGGRGVYGCGCSRGVLV
jgi:hypothetical protein